MYTVNEIADWFLSAIDRESGDTLSSLKLQKMMYYAQAWFLALNNVPLFEEDFEAWTHGPVLPSLWHRFKHYGYDALPLSEINHDISLISEEDSNFLNDILKSYGELSGRHLEELTHSEEPWKKARGHLPIEARSNNIITKEDMRDFYSKLYKELDT